MAFLSFLLFFSSSCIAHIYIIIKASFDLFINIEYDLNINNSDKTPD